LDITGLYRPFVKVAGQSNARSLEDVTDLTRDMGSGGNGFL